ncbi:MAG TPA: glycosyltransferase, partial [Candidatus Limnocylindria bacterium]|nr:glycosyltransferase [Candidatus Limnocylindria bacterium]
MASATEGLSIVVVIPCYNEEATIKHVVNDFRHHLPDTRIYIYDNNSSDQTAEAARDAGAVVRLEPLRGKGNVVRR